MAHFLDGPAAGTKLMLHRAPIMLRVVREPGKEWDALDQPTDMPTAKEEIHLYRMVGTPRPFHLLCARGSKAATGWYEDADYKLLPESVPDEILRDNAKWAAWCDANKDRLLAEREAN